MSILSRCEHAIGKPLLHATYEDLGLWIDEHPKLAPRSRYTYISHLGMFFKWAVLEELIDADPTVRLIRPKLRLPLPRPIPTEDVLRIIEQAPNTALAAMLTLAAHAGLRCMEIANLDTRDVMAAAEPPVIIVHGKGNKQRVIPIGPEILEALARHRLPMKGPVFRHTDGGRLTPWRVSAFLRKHIHSCGIVASGHQLRHSYATEFYRKSGRDLRMTQEMLGHSSPTTTSIYTQFVPGEAAAIVGTLYRPALSAPTRSRSVRIRRSTTPARRAAA